MGHFGIVEEWEAVNVFLGWYAIRWLGMVSTEVGLVVGRFFGSGKITCEGQILGCVLVERGCCKLDRFIFSLFFYFDLIQLLWNTRAKP